MALLDMDTFNWTNSEATLHQGRFQIGTVGQVSVGKPYQGSGMRWFAANDGPGFHGSRGTRIITGAMYMPDGDHVSNVLNIIGNGGSQTFLRHLNDGAWQVVRGSTTLHTFVDPYARLLEDRWVWIEADVTLSNTVGTWEVWINGEKIIDISGLDNQNSADGPEIDYYKWSTGTLTNARIGSVYSMDATGLTNNAVTGPWDIEMIKPDGDGNRTDFTPDSGLTNWEMVDELVLDEDTTFVEGSVVGDDDLYTYEDLVSSFDTIYGVQVSSMLKKTAGGERLVRQLTRSNTDEAESVSQGVPIDYSRNQGIFETDPQGGAAWTVARVNAAEFGHTIFS